MDSPVLSTIAFDSIIAAFRETYIGTAVEGLMRMEDSLVAYADTMLSRFADNPEYNIDSLKNYLVELALIQNAEINDSNSIEEYSKIVNDIYIKYFAFDALQYDPYDEELLRNIAWLCPYQYGNAVYDARALLTVIDTIYEYYSNACSESLFKGVNAEHGNKIVYSVYPNPAKGILTVDRRDTNKVWHLTITDATGRKINSDVLQENIRSTQIDLENHTPGLYMLTISGSDIGSNTIKLIIIP